MFIMLFTINFMLPFLFIVVPNEGKEHELTKIELTPSSKTGPEPKLQTQMTSSEKTCIESDKKCTDGWCYRPIDKCDGYRECIDFYDESPELCKDAPDITKFYCYNGHEINITQICDGITDCNDGSDEADIMCNDAAVEECAIPNTSTLTIQCEFKGVPIPCQHRVRSWATAKIFCNLGYVPKNDTLWVSVNKCRNSGKWIHRMPLCTYECGTPINDNHAWNVIIYERFRNGYDRYEQRCHGTLVTPFHVLTDDSCTYKKGIKNAPLEDIKVGLSYLDSNKMILRNDEPNTVRKLIEVRYIKRITDWSVDYYDIRTDQYQKNYNYSNINVNLTLLELKTHVNVNDYKAVCFDVNRELRINRNTNGKVIALLDPGVQVFRMLNVHILSKEECQKHMDEQHTTTIKSIFNGLNFDEFCGVYNSCEPNCTAKEENLAKSSAEITDGSGLTIRFGGKYYLIGIYVRTYNISKDFNETIQVHVFSDVRIDVPLYKFGKRVFTNIAATQIKSLDLSHLHRSSNREKRKCPVPYSYGTAYADEPCLETKYGCPELLSHQKAEEYSTIFMYCKTNYTLKGSCNYKVCKNNKWLPQDNSCVRMCEPLTTAASVKTECSYEGKNTSCTDKVMADTVATSTCQIAVNKDLTSYENKCLHSGNWRDSAEVIEVLCIDLCGILKSERALIQYGADTNSTYHPWNAGLYYKYKNEPYRHICGGTLISKYVVLTAAHCIQDPRGRVLCPEELKIGLGKFYRQFDHPDDTVAQIRDVENVFKSGLYGGHLSAFTSDIAIIELKNPADLNDFVVPACIDTSNKFSVKENYTGTVVGWGLNGIDEYAEQTDVLMKAELPYLTRETCIQLSKNKYNITVTVTIDKFCAFNIKDGKAIVRQGDSGAGLTFKFEGRHYLYGIVSIQASNKTSMFTNVTYPDHLEFINKELNKILDNKKKNNMKHQSE